MYGPKGEPQADPATLMLRILSASSQAHQPASSSQDKLVHDGRTGQVLWDLSTIAAQNMDRIKDQLMKVHSGAQAASYGFPLVVQPTANELSSS
jgi:hypothetical protein